MSDINQNFFDEKYNKMTDENLLQEITQNQNNIALDCLIDRYKDVVGMKANKFFMVGSEKDDMLQEGYIGLYKAVKSYDQEKQNSFKTFAGLCIERQMITAVKNSNRQKHIPLNSSLSLNSGAYDENDDTEVMEILDTRKTGEDPLDIITQKEYFTVIEKAIDDSLSDFEKKVLVHYKNGESYAEIAEILQSKVKSVDTAIQRIRKKAMKIKQKIEEGEVEK
jgi:RNA polymerase sigma factor, sigma-70 family